MYKSETSKFRHLFLPYCKGNGVDIGFGGDPIVPDAITVDLAKPYAECGTHPVNVKITPHGILHINHLFNYNSLDYVYSSHLLEDYSDTHFLLCDWISILRPYGFLCLLLPNEERYRQYCEKTNQPRNNHHFHKNFSLQYVKNYLLDERLNIVFEQDKLIYDPEQSDYNFAIVAQKPE